MLTQKEEFKFNWIAALWIKGQRKDAAKKINGLTKLGIALLLNNISLNPTFSCNPERQYDFSVFVESALEGSYDYGN